MFSKFKFEEKLILFIILVFAIASNYHQDNYGLDIFFGKYLMSFCLLVIGIWGVFVENGIANTSDQVQVAVVAAVTQYLLTRPIEWNLGYSYRYLGTAAYLALILISTLLSSKYFALVERFFRFTFTFTFVIFISWNTYIFSVFGYPIYISIGLAAVFYKPLTFKRMSIVSSIYLFSRMAYLGFDSLMLYITHFDRNSPYFYDYYVFINFVTFVIFIGASYYQLRNDAVNREELLGSVNQYSTFNNPEASNNATSA